MSAMTSNPVPADPDNGSDTGSDTLSEIPDHCSDSSEDGGPENTTVIREMAIHAFHGDHEQVVDSEDDILNLAGDDDDDDDDISEISSLYEDLGFTLEPVLIVECPVPVAPSSGETDVEMSDSSYDSWSDEEEEVDEENPGVDDQSIEAKMEESKNDHAQPEAADEAREFLVADGANQNGNAVVATESFAQLQGNPFPFNAFLASQDYERAQWRVMELEEIKRAVEWELAEALNQQDVLGKALDTRYEDFCEKTERIGISRELWHEYQAFCESMEPECGSTNGWSLTCEADHNGSYVNYDPNFTLYKEHSELPWNEYNFRCEAGMHSNDGINWNGPISRSRATSPVVEFWPVLYPGANIVDALAWGDLYPTLYDLAAKAARDGSTAAMDMLVALPNREASFKGGWLFEYAIANPSACGNDKARVTDAGFVWAKNPVHSRRWSYRSAHRVDAPETAVAKRERLRASLGLVGHVF